MYTSIPTITLIVASKLAETSLRSADRTMIAPIACNYETIHDDNNNVTRISVKNHVDYTARTTIDARHDSND